MYFQMPSAQGENHDKVKTMTWLPLSNSYWLVLETFHKINNPQQGVILLSCGYRISSNNSCPLQGSQ